MSQPLHVYDLSSVPSLLSALKPYLPTCLPLYRRLQFGHFTQGSLVLCSLDPLEAADVTQESAKSLKPWSAAYFDRTRRPETEGFVFGSWETYGQEESGTRNQDSRQEAESLVRELVKQVRQSGGIGGPNEEVLKAKNGFFDSHVENKDISLFGAVHEATAQIFDQLGLVADGFPVGPEIANNKWVFDLQQSSQKVIKELPEGLFWGEVKQQHYDLVRSRTQIPRMDRTLIQLPSVAIYPRDPTMEPETEPIAWAFLGVDASLTTLHVEPQYRGRGLAKAVTLHLWKTGMHDFTQSSDTKTDLTEWTHADVLVENDASNGVSKSLGGKHIYVDYWIRVDTSKA